MILEFRRVMCYAIKILNINYYGNKNKIIIGIYKVRTPYQCQTLENVKQEIQRHFESMRNELEKNQNLTSDDHRIICIVGLINERRVGLILDKHKR